jgi:hypothetical protein
MYFHFSSALHLVIFFASTTNGTQKFTLNNNHQASSTRNVLTMWNKDWVPSIFVVEK